MVLPSDRPDGPGEDGRLRPPAAGTVRRRSRRFNAVQKKLVLMPDAADAKADDGVL